VYGRTIAEQLLAADWLDGNCPAYDESIHWESSWLPPPQVIAK
jgi:hypothetical protein